MSETWLGSLDLDELSLSLLSLLGVLDVLLDIPQLGLIDEDLLAAAGLNQNMLAATAGLRVARLGPGLDLDDLLLAVLGLQDQLLGPSPSPASFLYEELLLAWLGGLGGLLHHQLLPSLGVPDDDVLPAAVLQELLQGPAS